MSFKTFDLAHDVASIVSSINEVVFLSSSIFLPNANIKFYSNIASASAGNDLGGYFQTIFDSSPSSSLSTPLVDLTYGYATGSAYNLPVTATASQNEKIKIYRMMASALLGSPDQLFTINNKQVSECFFMLVKRGIQKDELKKGSTSLVLNRKYTTEQATGSDDGSVVAFKQTVGGDFAPLKSGSEEIGQVWFNAGVIVLGVSSSWHLNEVWSGSQKLSDIQAGGTINNMCDGLRGHIEKISLHNQTNLYSTIYFCRAFNTEFNYSSNPTYVDENKRIRVTSGSNILTTRTYITTVGLYDANDNLLGVAKVNKPLTKSPDNEATLRIRLDY